MPLHLAQFKASSPYTPITVSRISFSIIFHHHLLRRPGDRLPATWKFVTLLRGSLSCLHLTCLYHHNCVLLSTCSNCSTSHLPPTSKLLSRSICMITSCSSRRGAFCLKQVEQTKLGSSLKVRSPEHLLRHHLWLEMQRMKLCQTLLLHTPQGYLSDLITTLFSQSASILSYPGSPSCLCTQEQAYTPGISVPSPT